MANDDQWMMNVEQWLMNSKEWVFLSKTLKFIPINHYRSDIEQIFISDMKADCNKFKGNQNTNVLNVSSTATYGPCIN